MCKLILHPAYQGQELSFEPALDYETTKGWLRSKFWYISEQGFEDRYHDTLVRFLSYQPNLKVKPLTIIARMFLTVYSYKDRREPLDTSDSYEQENEDGDVYHIHHEELVQEHSTDALDLLRIVKKVQLSELQAAVLRGTLEGMTDQQIADELKVGRTRVNGIYNYQLLKKYRDIVN